MDAENFGGADAANLLAAPLSLTLSGMKQMKITIENIKNSIGILREAIIVIAFILVLVFPNTFNSILQRAGFTKGSLLGFDWKKSSQETKVAAQEVADTNQQLKDLEHKLKSFEKTNSLAQPDSNINELKEQVHNLIEKTNIADKALKISLIQQEAVLSAAGKEIAADSGWIFLGRVNQEKDSWTEGSPETVKSTKPDLDRGTILTIIDDVYLRGETNGKWHSQGPVLSVAKFGEKVEVIEKDYSSARIGGWFVWAKVKSK